MIKLVAWATLNGNIDNFGEDADVVLNCNSPQYTVGKIFSKAITRPTIDNPLYASNVHIYDSETVMCWFNTQPDFTKTTPEYDKMTILTIGDNHEGICLFADKGDTLTLDVYTEKAVLRTASTRYNRNTWNHVAVTLNQEAHNTKLYLNGELVIILDYPSGLHYGFFDYRNYGIGSLAEQSIYPLQGYISDYRVYTEEMSKFNISLTSEGLIAYYKLDNGGDNLLNGIFNLETSTSIETIEIDDALKENVSGKKLTLSYEYLIRDLNDGNNEITFNLTGPNGVLSFNWQLDNDFNRAGTKEIVLKVPDGLTFESASLNVNATARKLTISNIKLEFGSRRTKYKPNRNELAFDALGFSNYMDDTSGNNDVLKYNTSFVECIGGNNKVFESSPKFNGNVDNIMVSKLKHEIYDEMTCSFWFTPCKNVNGQKWQYVLAEGRPDIGRGYGAHVTETSISCIYGDAVVTAQNLEIDRWYHATFTVDKNYKLSLYIDGELVSSKNITSLPDYVDNIGLCVGGYGTKSGFYYPFCGKVADIKIFTNCIPTHRVFGYATTGVIFDDYENIICREAKEY